MLSVYFIFYFLPADPRCLYCMGSNFHKIITKITVLIVSAEHLLVCIYAIFQDWN